MTTPPSQPPEQDAPTAQIKRPKNVAELDPPGRLLLGPGPSPVHPRVARALAARPDELHELELRRRQRRAGLAHIY